MLFMLKYSPIKRKPYSFYRGDLDEKEKFIIDCDCSHGLFHSDL